MHAIRAFIRSHLYGTDASPHRDTPGIASRPDGTARRRRARALTRALVRVLRSFDPRHDGAPGAHGAWRATA